MIIVTAIAGLYFIEISKIKTTGYISNAMSTLDELDFDQAAKNWEEFYKVRATILDGQRAEFNIPEKLQQAEGKNMELTGAAVFFSPGCKIAGDKIVVHSFFLYPTLGFANACVNLPEIAMRWTVCINLDKEWIVSKTEMIDAVVKVNGTFRIDTSKPYESAFFLDIAKVEFAQNQEEKF